MDEKRKKTIIVVIIAEMESFLNVKTNWISYKCAFSITFSREEKSISSRYGVCLGKRKSYMWVVRKKEHKRKNEYKEICLKRMQTKKKPITLVSHFFLRLLFHSLRSSSLEYFWKLFQYHAQFEKTLCVKKGNKNNIIHIYTSSNSMCVCIALELSLYPAAQMAYRLRKTKYRNGVNENEKKMKQVSEWLTDCRCVCSRERVCKAR